jgi:hypothetical protein
MSESVSLINPPKSELERRVIETRMQQAFGQSFEDVRPRGEAGAGQASAQAFTTGRDIFFAPGAYAPGSREGKQLMAHELTHTVQQRGGVAPPK